MKQQQSLTTGGGGETRAKKKRTTRGMLVGFSLRTAQLFVLGKGGHGGKSGGGASVKGPKAGSFPKRAIKRGEPETSGPTKIQKRSLGSPFRRGRGLRKGGCLPAGGLLRGSEKKRARKTGENMGGAGAGWQPVRGVILQMEGGGRVSGRRARARAPNKKRGRGRRLRGRGPICGRKGRSSAQAGPTRGGTPLRISAGRPVVLPQVGPFADQCSEKKTWRGG